MTTGKPWHFVASVDLDEWLPVISTDPRGGQDNPAYAGDVSGLICAFHPDFKPSEANTRLIAAAPEMREELFRLVTVVDAESAHGKRILALLNRIDGKEAQ